MKTPWHTAWQASDIVVFHDDVEVDRFIAAQIERVIFVHRGTGSTLGNLAYALVELPDEHILLPAETGFAGRVHFERQSFWAEKRCVYWVPEHKAPLPVRLRPSLWFLRPSSPAYARLPRAQLTATLERWPLEGPQTWEQRKWKRITLNLPFSSCRAEETESLAKRRRA